MKSQATKTNRFSCLEIEDGEIVENDAENENLKHITNLKDDTREREVLVIGDCIVKQLDGPIRQKLIGKSAKVECKSFPKIRVDALKNKIKADVKNKNKRSLKVVVLTGTNDVKK